MPLMLVTREIAEAYRSKQTSMVNRWRRQGKLPFIRLPGRGYRYRRERCVSRFGRAEELTPKHDKAGVGSAG